MELCQTCITLDMDLTSYISDLPQRYPIFWTNLSVQCSFSQPMVCCFHQRRNVVEERRVAFLVYQVYLCGRCPLTCQTVRLSHSVGTSAEQSRVYCGKHTKLLKIRKKKSKQQIFLQTLSQFPFVHSLASNIYFGVGQRGGLAACLPSGVESFA